MLWVVCCSMHRFPRAALVLSWLIFPALAAAAEFRVLPYVLNPRMDGVTLVWFSEQASAGSVTITGGGIVGSAQGVSTPELADTLAYHSGESSTGRYGSLPYRHVVEISGLPQPGTSYAWAVAQDGEVVNGSFRTVPDPESMPDLVRIIAFADSETEPESTGKKADWGAPSGAGRPVSVAGKYLLDQTEGFRANLALITARNPDLLLIAGDLVESGGEQRDWDEFWRHIAGSYAHLPGTLALLPALGNHENFGGPGSLGAYGATAANRAVEKYRTYFPLPSNGAADLRHQGRYYRQDFGRVTILTLDSSDGRPQGGDQDTNFNLDGDDELLGAPDFNEGSAQWLWAVAELRRAARAGQLIIVQFHHAPYSSGPHGTTPGAGDNQSGTPMRVYSPLFEKYGVRLVISGHDEMLEHSIVNGVHYWDAGIGGDGLRAPTSDLYNDYREWLAHYDAPEAWSGAQLLSGGKHYGHLEIDITPAAADALELALTPVMNFPLMDAAGTLTGAYERREYTAPQQMLFTPLPYARWLRQNFTSAELAQPALTSDDADGDGDGLAVLVEYALAANPKSPTPMEPAIQRKILLVEGVPYLALEVTRNPMATDLTYRVEGSDNLSTWNGENLVTMTDEPDLLLVRDALPLGHLPGRSLRCRVTWLE